MGDAGFFASVLLFIMLCLVGTLAGCPAYKVYYSEKSGAAAYAYAETERRVKVLEAQAELDSAKLLNAAEVARAEGLKQATALVSQSFGGPENYLKYLWIQSIKNNDASVIYVPTEAGLPILEAGRATEK